MLFAGFGAQDLPLLGGLLVPSAELVIVGLATDAAGQLELHATWPVGAAALQPFVLQLWMLSPDAAGGVEATNAVALTP